MAYTLHEIGYTQYVLGDIGLALRCLRESERTKEEIGDQWGQVTSINQIARLLTESGENGGAAVWLEKGDRIAAAVGNPDLFCRLAVARGRLALETGDIGGAVTAKDRAVEQANKAMLKNGKAEAILLWARIDDARGFQTGADVRYLEALALYKEMGDQLGQGVAQFYRGHARARAGEAGAAREALASAADKFRAIGARLWLENAEGALEAISRKLGEK